MPRNVRDANLTKSIALPAAAGAVQTAGIYLETGTRADFTGGAEFLIEAPALATGALPDTKTMTYIIEHDTDPAFGTAVSLYGTLLLQTGAGGAGAAAASKRVGIPSDIKPYVRLKATGGAAIGDCSGSSAVLSMVF